MIGHVTGNYMCSGAPNACLQRTGEGGGYLNCSTRLELFENVLNGWLRQDFPHLYEEDKGGNHHEGVTDHLRRHEGHIVRLNGISRFAGDIPWDFSELGLAHRGREWGTTLAYAIGNRESQHGAQFVLRALPYCLRHCCIAATHHANWSGGEAPLNTP